MKPTQEKKQITGHQDASQINFRKPETELKAGPVWEHQTRTADLSLETTAAEGSGAESLRCWKQRAASHELCVQQNHPLRRRGNKDFLGKRTILAP